MSQVCYICSKPLAESEIVAVEHGLKTLIDSSIEREPICDNPCAVSQNVHSKGQSCSNIESNTTDENVYDINEEISDRSFFLEQSIEIQQHTQGEEESEEHITVEEFEDYLDDS
ncbi:hypothetical protein AVEN_185407-1 [Araneus ventricosus]|uniref:Uncharacterized protein n=1 Tax=Araneus ventricosus TaxID=182803 RepID=A0A4Y2CHL2_ARAVE|nr:hypothetical protein AVEN_185407-1 [Araneus ventricosus]